MALIDTVPTTKVKLPSVVVGQLNGRLPASLLRNFDGRGNLLEVVSYGMQALHLAAWTDQVPGFGPIDTETVGRYRTYAQQVAVLKQRADPGPVKIPGRKWYRFWDGQWWSGKLGTAPVATPGESNHGWAAADDVAEENNGRPGVDSMSDHQLGWMRDNAPSFGFGLESRVERWHWHWISGDVLPARAIAVLRYCGIDIPAHLAPPPEPPPVTPEALMFPMLMRLKGFADVVLIDGCQAMPVSGALLTALRAGPNRPYESKGDAAAYPWPFHEQTKQWLEHQLGYALKPTADGG